LVNVDLYNTDLKFSFAEPDELDDGESVYAKKDKKRKRKDITPTKNVFGEVVDSNKFLSSSKKGKKFKD
jgi:hypothetical protein